jgi:hypothetical protein
MKYYLAAVVFLFFATICRAQVLQDRVTGKYNFDVKNTDVKGSPLFV